MNADVREDPVVAVERALLAALLEERLGEAAAPESRSIASASKPWRLLAAAVLLLGIGSLVAVYSLQHNEGEESPKIGAPPSQDKIRRPEVSTNRWQPSTAEALRQALPDIQRVRVRMHRVHGMRVKATDFPPGPLVPILETDTHVQRLRTALGQALARPAGVIAKDGDHVLHIELTEHRHFEATLLTTDERASVLLIAGLGGFPIDRDAAELLSVQMTHRDAVAKTVAALGLAHPDHMSELPVSSRHLRLHEFGPGDLAAIERFDITSVDMSVSPKLSGPTGLHALRAVCPDLETLRLGGGQLDADSFPILARFAKLQDLQVVDPKGSYWGVPEQRDAEVVDDGAVPHLLALVELRSLVLPGSSLSDRGIAGLAALPGLQRLILSGTPGMTGVGFQAFVEHENLVEIHLNACTDLSDGGLEALAKVPKLRQLFLRKVRRLHPATLADMRGNVSPAGLASLERSARLERLELGGWFETTITNPLRYAKAEKDDSGSILHKDWRPALTAVCKAPRLEWLAIDGCPDFVLQDLEFLRDAPIQTLNLAGTVGKSPARIPVGDLDHIFGLPRNLQTIIHED